MSHKIYEQTSRRVQRSELAVPGSNPKMFEKALNSDVDFVFLDLEDAVAPDDKVTARKNVIQALQDLDWQGNGKTVSVRINSIDTHYMYRDVIEIIEEVGDKIDTLLIPKVGSSSDVYMVDCMLNQIEQNKKFENTNELKMISFVRNNFSQWSQDDIPNEEFYKNTNWLIENNFINVEKTVEEIEYDSYLFDRYVQKILKNKGSEIRYIEYPNPSQDVIKKFLRDVEKWNFEEEVGRSSNSFPSPTYEIIDETYIIKYKIYINEQPQGLPLDHTSTLQNSFEFWEKVELKTNNQNARIVFEITNTKSDANVWVTWVVRNIGEGVLGHAHLGKGVVEVALGDYNCDGSFQLYDVKSVEKIMTHELGHSIGLPHTNDKENIMYPSMAPSYAYCILSWNQYWELF